MNLGADLQCNPNVGGTGNYGFDIVGHNGTLNEPGYSFTFMAPVEVLSIDGDFISLRTDFTVDGSIGQLAPEPATFALLGSALLGLALLRLSRARCLALAPHPNDEHENAG